MCLRLRVQPKASCDEVVGRHGDALRVRITAAPTDGKANRHLLAFLAAAFKVPRARVTLARGTSGRDKQVCIEAPVRLPAWLPADCHRRA